MQGVSAHLEYVGPKGRKRKKDCIYYNNEICRCKKSNYYLFKCGGRCACIYYDDSESKGKYYNTYSEEVMNTGDKSTKYNTDKKREKNPSKYCSTQNYINNKKIKVEDVVTKKKYLIQLVPKDKENQKACMFYTESKIGQVFLKCKVGDIIRFVMNGETCRFKVKQIK